MVSKACVVGAYQTKLELIGQTDGVDLTVIVPPAWKESGGNLPLETLHTEGYQLLVEPMRLNGQYHVHYYPSLRRRLHELKPDIVHMDEEPYSFVTWQGMRYARQIQAKTLFFSWQNIFRTYPPPFRWMEQQILRWADFGQMGNAAADAIWREKGFKGESEIFPQFGVSLDLFTPRGAPDMSKPFVIGSASRRLNEGKGVDLMLTAAARLSGDWQIRIAGDGPARVTLEQLAQSLNIADRVYFDGKIGSEEVPAYLQQMDVLVLPSRTQATWKEQFGRVLVEAMACEVPVIGSDSGEIPHVIGDAGLVFAEDNVDELFAHLQNLMISAETRAHLGKIGRTRALSNYTQAQIAARTVAVYERMLAQ